jgi:hypothetical protein
MAREDDEEGRKKKEAEEKKKADLPWTFERRVGGREGEGG